MRLPLLAGIVCLCPLWSVAAAAGELPSPDAMTLGAHAVPLALVDGFRTGIELDVLERVTPDLPAAEQTSYRGRAHAALSPLLDEAFPPELLAGIGAEFLAARYDADELRALRAREESPVGQKLQRLARAEAEIVADAPEARARARERLEQKLLSDGERRDVEAFAATPLGRKMLALAPDLAGHFVAGLEAHWREVRGTLEPRLRAAALSVRR